MRTRQAVSVTLALSLLLGAACAPRPAAETSAAAPEVVPATARAAGTAGAPDQVYFEFQVEEPVRPASGSCAPQYPDSLRAAKVRGTVVGQFVVDTAGLVQEHTIKVLRSTHPDFEASVRTALSCMRFTPAQIRGRRVRQLVQQPFEFAVAQ